MYQNFNNKFMEIVPKLNLGDDETKEELYSRLRADYQTAAEQQVEIMDFKQLIAYAARGSTSEPRGAGGTGECGGRGGGRAEGGRLPIRDRQFPLRTLREDGYFNAHGYCPTSFQPIPEDVKKTVDGWGSGRGESKKKKTLGSPAIAAVEGARLEHEKTIVLDPVAHTRYTNLRPKWTRGSMITTIYLGDYEVIDEAAIDSCCEALDYIDEVTANLLVNSEAATLQKLDKPLRATGFNGAQSEITRQITIRIRIDDAIDPECVFFITRFYWKSLISSKAWMKDHGCVLNIAMDEVLFFPPGEICRLERLPSQPALYGLLDDGCDTPDNNAYYVSTELEDEEVPRKNFSSQRFSMTEVPDEERILLRKIEGCEELIVRRKPSRSGATAAHRNHLWSARIAEGKCKLLPGLKGSDPEPDPKYLLPEELHDFVKVFSKHEADELPPLRRGPDHHMQLEKASDQIGSHDYRR
ncbi:hypothetical protein BJ878DRAFT_540178 [Calycina marina]|uniref:Uncharacterized protein n=1 Tax=Calycina marina TaxID=1763456 RepID=A0A9P8CH98_9HELO|nr:hypothetical protein BJ878DRAFT_540178 [Calycina marina]